MNEVDWGVPERVRVCLQTRCYDVQTMSILG